MFRFAHRVMVLALTALPALFAQTPAPDPAPGAPPAPTPAPSAFTKKGVDIYLLGDVYGDLNFNHPASGYTQLYNFNDKANQVHLSLAKISFEKASGILGFRVDLGTGRTLDIINAGDDGPSRFRHFEQMYVEFRPPKAHGLQIDFGKWVTSAGAEVIESNANWNYSRSLLFALAIPYYHFGARASLPVNKSLTAGVQVVNGWNSIGVNNGLKTVGLFENFTFKKGNFSTTYYTGPQNTFGYESYRQVLDTVVVINPTAKSSFYLNFDYATDKNKFNSRQSVVGFAAAGRYQLTNRLAFAPRAEVFSDRDGFATGSQQLLTEVTLTGELKMREGLFSRLEYRHDQSDKPYYERKSGMLVGKNQNTLTLAFIAFFGPKK